MREGWKETTLGEVAEVTMGQSPPGSSYNEAGDGLAFMQGSAEFGAVNPTPVKWCTDPSRIAETGDILVSVRAPVGDTNVADQRIAIGRGLAAVSAREDAALTPFIWTVIQLKVAELNSVSGSGMFASITGRNFRGLGILLPPLAEQKRIVDVIGAVDAYVASLESYANAARTARAALLHELLTTNTKGWKETTLGEVADVVGGGTPSTTRAEFWDGEIVWLTPTEVVALDGRRVSESERKITKQGLANSGARLLPKGTVILTSRASVGFVAISDCELCTNQGFQSLIPRLQVLAEFLLPWVQTNRSEFMARSAGSTFKEISKKNVATMRILLPPLAEQKRIVDVIESVDGAVASADRAAEDARNLRSGLLSDLLSGDHGIPESYDELLGAA